MAKVVLVSAQGPYFKTTLGLSFSLVFVLFSVFHFNIPRFFVSSTPLSYYSRFVSLVFSLLPLSFLRFCFVPSNQFPAIPCSNPPCFHFWSFRSSIIPLCTLWFSGLTFPTFSCWYLCGFLVIVVVAFFITGNFILSLCFGCFWLSKCGEG